MHNNRLVLSLMISSFIAGFVFWLIVYGKYIVLSLFYRTLPFDAFIFLIPILFISSSIGTLICMPILLILKNYGLLSLKVVIFFSVLVSLTTVLLITKQYQDVTNYIASVLAAISGTLILFTLIKRGRLS